jgi:hypothetical protein
MQPYLKDKINMARLTMERHIIVVSSLGSLDQFPKPQWTNY